MYIPIETMPCNYVLTRCPNEVTFVISRGYYGYYASTKSYHNEYSDYLTHSGKISGNCGYGWFSTLDNLIQTICRHFEMQNVTISFDKDFHTQPYTATPTNDGEVRA